jgi:hypothetical protein
MLGVIRQELPKNLVQLWLLPVEVRRASLKIVNLWRSERPYGFA